MVLGGSFGAGNYGMCGRAFDPNFLFMYPNAKISVMGGSKQPCFDHCKRTTVANRQDFTFSKRSKIEDKIRAKYHKEGHAYYSVLVYGMMVSSILVIPASILHRL